MQPPIALAVAAHDPLGGAGLAADLTTFAAHRVHGMVAVSAVTAQRFGSVDRVEPTSPDLLAAQLDAILAETVVDAVKIGLLSSADHVRLIAERIGPGLLPAPVVDPVMVTGRGDRFVAEEVEAAARELLYPQAAVLTPNHDEADLLGPSHAELAALGADLVVITGGRREADDTLIHADGTTEILAGEWIDTKNVRGSGCTFAAAIASNLAHGSGLAVAARDAKAFVAAQLLDSGSWELGPAGSAGPVSHRLPER
ncbi:MAG: hydroxymethylpyrimidine/phosphomethylpyrimidine kinase [Actinomycetota bacterium]